MYKIVILDTQLLHHMPTLWEWFCSCLWFFQQAQYTIVLSACWCSHTKNIGGMSPKS